MRRPSLRTGVATLVLAAVALGVWWVADRPAGQGGVSPQVATVGSGRAADVDGDGFEDLAVGMPDAPVQDQAGAGKVALIHGSRTGLTVSRHQSVSGSVTGDTVRPGDRFGSALALGDLDGDGHADLVIGASGRTAGGEKGAGAVTVVFGSRSGLSRTAVAFHAPAPTPGGRFGGQLALGDFDHDGLDDIAVVDGRQVAVVRGAKDLRSAGAEGITVHTPPGGGGGTHRIATGDVDGDGYDDLVTVAHDDDPADGGALGVLPGSRAGLKDTRLGDRVELPFAGYTPVVGDINGDGKDDVLLATGFQDGPDKTVLLTYPGSADGLDTAGAVTWRGPLHPGDTARLADLDGDGHDDLVVGDVHAVNSDVLNDAGAITTVRGSARWLDPATTRTLSLDTEGVAGDAESNDRFGSTLAQGDYNGDGTCDLAVGAPGKRHGLGGVGLLYGSASGLTGTDSIIFGPDSLHDPVIKASFGAALGG
ncbi:FG-GAP-like repeat-containing protein [Streptomyces sp. NPDC039022]|uniref:VCBS repeat-containing protein n=1 Tax=Streptomyces sp. NPDC039022 TaxID=3157091 RepID=UPI0033F7EFC4